MGLVVQAPIAVTSAAYVQLSASTFARAVSIAEDATGTAAGLIVKWPNGNVVEYTPAMQPIVIGNPGGGGAPLVGAPACGPAVSSYVGANPAATNYCQVKSMGATTAVRVSETN